MEHIALLTAEGIYHQIDSIFAKPINISLTMANDNLLKNFLIDEEQMADEGIFIQTLQSYLLAYKNIIMIPCFWCPLERTAITTLTVSIGS